MAQALKIFTKAFCRAFTHVHEWHVLSSYDRSVKSKHEPSRIYKLEPASVRTRAMESFSATSEYSSFAELVRDRTERGSRVARALHEDAEQTACELMASGRGFLAVDLWDELRVGFVRDASFRRAFGDALEADGLADDLVGFWHAVDDELALLDGAFADDIETVMEAQCGAVAACVFASLAGARDNRQQMGFALEQTPMGAGGIPLREGGPMCAAAQLVSVLMAGPDPIDYRVQAEGCSSSVVCRFSAEQGARIGRQDEAWCTEDGRCPVVTGAAFASRHHAEVGACGGRWILTDVGTDGAGSTHGTLVTPADLDALPVLLQGTSCELHHGDLICVSPRRVTSGGYDASNFSWASHVPGENFRFELVF